MVNGALDVDQHLLPNPSKLLATLADARNLLSLTYRRLISKFCWMRSQPSMLQSILIKVIQI